MDKCVIFIEFLFLFIIPCKELRLLPEVVERSLLSLLFIPLLALVFLLVWKVSWPLIPDTELYNFLCCSRDMTVCRCPILLSGDSALCRGIYDSRRPFNFFLQMPCRLCRSELSCDEMSFGIKLFFFLIQHRSDHGGMRRIFNSPLKKCFSVEQKGLHFQ